jgi:endonuclease G
VAYELTKEETNKLYDRTDNFVPDPKIASGSANNNDYAGSGYDRGHLAPAADMGWSSTTMAESFYYSNMSPQLPGFNRGIWKKLEELVRKWAVEYNTIEIVTGPVLSPGLPTIGADKVSIPKYYYKVILDYTEPDLKGIGFILPNASSSAPLQSYAVTIDSVERFSGINFFPGLPDIQEETLENTLCKSCWLWESVK